MESQNTLYVQQIGDLKRTIYELNNKIQALNQEHRFEIENVSRDMNDKHFAQV